MTRPFISQTEGGSRFAIVSIGIFLINLWNIIGMLSSFEHVNHHQYCSMRGRYPRLSTDLQLLLFHIDDVINVCWAPRISVNCQSANEFCNYRWKHDSNFFYHLVIWGLQLTNLWYAELPRADSVMCSLQNDRKACTKNGRLISTE